MSGECLCVHALRRAITNQVLVRVSARVSKKISAAAIGSSRAVGAVHRQVFASAQLTCATTLSASAGLLKSISGQMYGATAIALAGTRTKGVKSILTVDTSVTATMRARAAAQFTFLTIPPGNVHRGSISRPLVTALTVTPAGNIIPAFQYRMKIAATPKPPPRTQRISVHKPAESELKMITVMTPKLTYFLDAKAELKMETVVEAVSYDGAMSITFTFSPTLGNRPTMPMRDNRPVLEARDGANRLMPVKPTRRNRWTAPRPKWRSPNELHISQTHKLHNCYKVDNVRPACCNPKRFKLCCITTVIPRATSVAGELTRITKNKKLRLVQALHPDSKKQNPDGSFPPKKYVWRLTVHPENGPPCACEFIHLGLYNFRDSVWKFNESRPILLLVNSADYQSGNVNPCISFDPLPIPGIYPQFNEKGEYRVVMVKNLMYDIYPSATFVRTEYEGYPPSPVDREVILNEISHLVFVYEACGNGFFLINAECD